MGGEQYFLLDNKTSFDLKNDGDYNVSVDHIQEQLASGYRFMNFFAHGNQQNWRIEGINYFTSNDALSTSNQGYTLITTIACYTNAFDCHAGDAKGEDLTQDPCLSEAFIRNPNSGVLGYLGASNKGLRSSTDDIKKDKYGPSFDYELQFYRQLFSERRGFRNFAKVVSETKRMMASQIPDSASTSPNRWVHYCLNPVGDAEMPIYIYSPKVFDFPQISSLNNDITVSSEYSDCRITLSGKDASGKTFYGSESNKEGPVRFSNVTAPALYLCITRPDCSPLLYHGVRKSSESMRGKDFYEFTMCSQYPFAETSQAGARIKGCNLSSYEATILVESESPLENGKVTLSSYDSFGNLTERTGEIHQNTSAEYSAKVKVSKGSNVIILTSDSQITDSITVIN